jgi:hypothetical protein
MVVWVLSGSELLRGESAARRQSGGRWVTRGGNPPSLHSRRYTCLKLADTKPRAEATTTAQKPSDAFDLKPSTLRLPVASRAINAINQSPKASASFMRCVELQLK